MSNEKELARFEAWWDSDSAGVNNGPYRDDSAMQIAWEAWQAALAQPAQAAPAGWKVVPDWKGYARLGTGNYIINHSRAPADPELGAEIVITLADDSDRSGGRQVGERRDNPPDAPPIQPDEMVIRIGFVNERGLFALEDQLRMLRIEHGWAQPAQAEPVAWMVYTQDGKSVFVTDNPTDIPPNCTALPLFTESKA